MLFNRKQRQAAYIAALEANKAQLEAALTDAIKANEQLAARAFLIDITRAGRVNKFLFVRNGEPVTIETMGLISDDVEGWKERLIR